MRALKVHAKPKGISQVATPTLRSPFDHPPIANSLLVTLSIPPLVTRMTRAARFASYTSAVALCYFLAWFSVLPIPFIEEETKDQIIPLVRTFPATNHNKAP